MPCRCKVGIQNGFKLGLIKSCSCQSVSSWINYIMIFLIKAKPEQFSPQDQRPSCALFVIAQLLFQLRIFWRVSCLNGTAKLPTTLTGVQFCKMRTRSWSVESNLQEIFPFHPLLLTAAYSCSLPLAGSNSCSRMLWVIAVKLQRVYFIKHILLLDFHWHSTILSFQQTLFLYICWASDEHKVHPIYLF